MKNRYIFCWLIIASIVQFPVAAQSIKGTKLAISPVEINGFYDIHMNKLDPFEPFFPAQKKKYKEAMQYMDSLFRVICTDKVATGFKNNGIDLLPADTFTKYSSLEGKEGMSAVVTKKVLKGAFSQGLPADYVISTRFNFLNKIKVNITGSQKRPFIPVVVFVIFVYDKEVKQVLKKTYSVEGEPIEYESFDKMNKEHIADLVSHMEPLIENSINECLKEIN